MKIYTDSTNHEDVQVNEGNKWYTYLLPKDKGLFWMIGNSVKKVVVKADISFEGNPLDSPASIIPNSTIEASFKGSNTSKVTNIYGMFGFCSGLTSLDISNFDTSNVTYMDFMFRGCSGLTSLDLSNFNTINVTTMESMFSRCSGLESLDLSGWDMSNVTSMSNMFNGCSKLTTIRMVGCSEATIQKITDVKPSGATIVTK